LFARDFSLFFSPLAGLLFSIPHSFRASLWELSIPPLCLVLVPAGRSVSSPPRRAPCLSLRFFSFSPLLISLCTLSKRIFSSFGCMFLFSLFPLPSGLCPLFFSPQPFDARALLASGAKGAPFIYSGSSLFYGWVFQCRIVLSLPRRSFSGRRGFSPFFWVRVRGLFPAVRDFFPLFSCPSGISPPSPINGNRAPFPFLSFSVPRTLPQGQ